MTTHSIAKFAIALFATLTLANTSPSLQAQSPELIAKVNVPFGFEIGSRHFEPGVYDLRMQGNHILRIAGGSNSAIASTMNDSSLVPSPSSKVVFKHYGDKYFLSQVWSAGDTEHVQLYPTREESSAHKAVVASVAPTPNVTVALLQSPR